MVTIRTAAREGKALLRSLTLPRPKRTGGPLVHDEAVFVAGMFRTGSGLGRAARACYEALQAAGLQPFATDLSGLFDQIDLPSSVPFQQLDPSRPGTLILFANPPEVERALMGLGLRRWHNWRIIGAWAWELPAAPRTWARQARFVSEIWAPSRFVAEAFSAAYSRPVHNVPHFVPAVSAPTVPQLARRDGVMRILTISDARSSLARKDPLSAVKMFAAAFGNSEAACLTVKCRNLDIFPDYAALLRKAAADDKRITLLDKTLSIPDQDALIAEHDVVLSPHRSEGFGVHLAEAMALGKCVIATGWSGNLEFMSADCSILLPFTMVPVDDPTSVYAPERGAVWAKPDFDAGVSALRQMFADPVRRLAIGKQAQVRIGERLIPSAYLAALQSGARP